MASSREILRAGRRSRRSLRENQAQGKTMKASPRSEPPSRGTGRDPLSFPTSVALGTALCYKRCRDFMMAALCPLPRHGGSHSIALHSGGGGHAARSPRRV